MMMNAAVVRTDLGTALQVFVGRMQRAQAKLMVRRSVGSVKSKSSDVIHPVMRIRSVSALSTLGGLKMSLGRNATQCSAMQMEKHPFVHRHSTAMRTAGVSLAVCAIPLKIVAKV